MILKPGLYIVSTPIGNLEDITYRAVSTLKNSNIILCEDTRISQKLLAKHGIKVKLHVYNDHSSEKNRQNIKDLINQGNIVSLISDAGTPLISDPGYKLVRDLRNLDYHVEAVPGVSSPITALTISALPSDRFLFCGFLPKTTPAKKKIFIELKEADINATMIFFEAATRLIESLKTAREIFGNRAVCVARELTKLYQEVKTDNIDNIIEFYEKNLLKGEIVLLVSGNLKTHNKKELSAKLQDFIKLSFNKKLSAKTIADLACKQFSNSYNRKEIYKIVNEIKTNEL